MRLVCPCDVGGFMAWIASSKGAVHVGGDENIVVGVEAVHGVAEK